MAEADDTVFEAITGQEWVFEVASFEREVSRYRAGAIGDADEADSGFARSSSGVAPVAVGAKALNDVENAELPAKPGPRAAQPASQSRIKDWSQTG